MFWISYANRRCGAFTDEYLKWQIENDEHAPHSARVNVPMSNRPEFSEDFKCTPGSKMNPIEKCEVW